MMQDYKCVHCSEMYDSPQAWLDHCQEVHGDRELKVFVRHVSFSEKASHRRPMYVMKNFHMKVRDLDSKASRIDGELRLKTVDESKSPSEPQEEPKNGTFTRRNTFGRYRRHLTLTEKSHSVDSSLLAESRRLAIWNGVKDDSYVANRPVPWWQRRPSHDVASTIHSGTGSLTVTLSKSSTSLADSGQSRDRPIRVVRSHSRDSDISDYLDNLDLDDGSEKNDHKPSNGIRTVNNGELRQTQHQVNGTNQANSQRRLIRSPYPRSARSASRELHQGSESAASRDDRVGSSQSTTIGSAKGRNQQAKEGSSGSDLREANRGPVPTSSVSVNRVTFDKKPRATVVESSGENGHTCNGHTAQKVTQWINQNQAFNSSVQDNNSDDSDSSELLASGDPGFVNVIYREAPRLHQENMGANSSGPDAKSARKFSPVGTRSVRGVKDIGKINNRYSTGALLDIAQAGASWVIPGQNGTKTKQKTRDVKRAQDDISISKMPTLSPVDAFRRLCAADSFDDSIKSFGDLCLAVGLKDSDRRRSYDAIRSKVNCPEASKFFRLLDARAAQPEYGGGKISENESVLVIGGGPCGLRTAIECALLGAKRVAVVEMRNYATRNNVLHLWPTAANDIKAIGAKVFYPKFCAGAIHHVSIRRLQLILMKTALILGVEIHAPVRFEELLPPNPSKRTGWRARVTPATCPVNDMEFRIVVGADGKSNALDFPRKFTRGKVSIAITANFKNTNSGLHTRVSEIPGVISVKRPDLFGELKKKTGMEFENFVYFRDETHYFIMTAKKKSILEKGIVKKETADLRAMFHPNNLNRDKLLDSVKTIAQTAWRVDNPSFPSLPDLDFELDRYGREDVAIFDFAALHQAEHASLIKERHGHKLLMCIVGDTLLEPFWPTGSGIAKGFLGCLDAAWTIRSWSTQQRSDLEVIAERESVFRVLPQVSPDNLLKDKNTIDPKSRYGGTTYGGRLPLNTVKTKDVQHLYNTGDAAKRKSCGITFQELPKEKRRLYRGGSIDTHRLVGWYKEKLARFSHLVKVADLTKSWTSGLALCALVQTERPDLMDVSCLDRHDCRGNIQKAFDIIEREFGVEQMMAPEDLANKEEPDRLTMMSYLFHIYEYIMTKDDGPITVSQVGQGGSTPSDTNVTRKPSAFGLLNTIANSTILLRTLHSDAQRVQDMDVDRFAAAAAGAPGMDYFLKTASLDRRARSKVHMAVRRSKTVKSEQAAKKWRQKTRERKIKRQASEKAAPSQEAGPEQQAESKENREPAADRTTEGTAHKERSRSEANMQSTKGVKFTEGTKIDDGPSEALDEDAEAVKRGMMSLPRQACGGVASRAIQAFKALENKTEQHTNQTDITHPPDTVDLVEQDPDQNESENKGGRSITRRSAFRLSGELSQEERNAEMKRRAGHKEKQKPLERQPGINTLKRTGEICCICDKKLYLVERHNAQGHFLHRACFKCHHCHTSLRVGNYVKIEDPDGNPTFYCIAHAYQSGQQDTTLRSSSDEEAETKDDDTLKKSDEGIKNEFCGPLTDEELRYFDGSDEDEENTDEEDIDSIYEFNKYQGGGAQDSSTLRSLLADLDGEYQAENTADIDDLESVTTDTSSQLVQQEIIQQGLEEIETEREQLEEEGVQLEKMIRGEAGDRLSTVQGDLLNNWLDVARKKRELNEQESRLMLQLRLMGLQERLRAMLEMVPSVSDHETGALAAKVEHMETVTERLEQAALREDVTEMMSQMRDMKTFLNHTTQC